MSTVAFKTMGCRLNQAETARIAAQFESAGYEIVPFGEPCDVCVVHSCTITANAERKSLQQARSARRGGEHTYVILAGCAAELDDGSLKTRSGADLVAGQGDKFDLPAILAAQHDVTLPAQAQAESPRFPTTRALLKVQDGCDFRCAYCIVPDARGPSVSRPLDAVLAEAEAIARAGYREVVLTGANLGCYHHDNKTLIDLLAALERIPGIVRLRLSSIESSTTEREVIEYMTTSQKLCHSLHIPLQTGDDDLLAAMGRHYRVAEYKALINFAASRIPRLGVGTDILVGLPGETPDRFLNTRRVIEALPFSNLHIFPYSKRPGTPAATMPDQVPGPQARERAAELQALADTKRDTFARQFIGSQVTMLVESVDGNGVGKGWTGEYLEARVSAIPLEKNDVLTFEPAKAQGGILYDT